MSRDDHFAGWAKAVLAKMKEPDDGRCVWWESDADIGSNPDTEDVWLQILARAGYDLALHVASHVSERAAALMETEIATPQEIVAEIPDLPEETKA